MNPTCRVCLKPGPDCRKCLEALFGENRAPHIEVDLARLHTLALSMVGKTSLSGVQRKISVGFGRERQTLQVDVAGARFILKPQTETFPMLPENEHLTMRLAALAGIEIPPCGLFPLSDGTPAYIVRRFDRRDDGGKLRTEDFCQLAERPPKEKYEGSTERCFTLVRRWTTEPGIEALALYRLLVFSWWVGNGDLHLKNLALLTEEDGFTRLSPAYDLLSTRIVIPDDDLALTVAGKRGNLNKKAWLQLAETARLPIRAAERVLGEPARQLTSALELVEASALSTALKEQYARLLSERAAFP